MTRFRSRFVWFLALGAIAAGAALWLQRGSSRTLPNRNPVGELFPAVVGQSLEEVRTEMPAAFAGEPAVLLVGYEQNAQFDIDRWFMGLLHNSTRCEI